MLSMLMATRHLNGGKLGMHSYIKAAAVGGLAGGLFVGLAFLVLGSGLLLGRDSAPAMASTISSRGQLSHQDMHRMMDAVHGDGTSQRTHEAMGPDAEEMMDQCASMMAMMQEMQSMISSSGSGMMGGQNGDSMRDMMRRMMEQ